MLITEYENDLDYVPSQMSCDKVLSECIKEPLPNMSHFMCIVGIPGSGKTSLMMSMLTHPEMYRKVFHHIYLCMPKSSRSSLPGEPFKDHPEDKCFEDLTLETLEDVHEKCKETREKKQYSLLILDDCATELKKHFIEKKLTAMVRNRRHLYLSIWILSQDYLAIPRNLRKIITDCVMFRPNNKLETEALFKELIYVPQKQHDALLAHVFPPGEEHGFMFLNATKKKLHKKFNFLKIED